MKKKTTTKKTATKKSKPAARKSAPKKSTPRKVSSSAVSKPKTLTFLTESLPEFRVGRLKKTSIKAVGGTQPYSFGLSQGSTLPPGLQFNYRGTLWGKPTQSGDTTIFVKVVDFIGANLTQAFDLEVADA
jgi:hypothetical protein